MTILQGKHLLERLKRQISDDRYAIYDDLNRAQNELARQTNFFWLKQTQIKGAGLVPDQKEYSLGLGNVKSITSIWIADSELTSIPVNYFAVDGSGLSELNVVCVNDTQTNVAPHGLSTGDTIYFQSMEVTTGLVGNSYIVTVNSVSDFDLDGTLWSDFDVNSGQPQAGSASVPGEDDNSWEMMEEVPDMMYEDQVKRNSQQSGSVINGTDNISTRPIDEVRLDLRWVYHFKGAPSNPFAIMSVSPTPSKVYKIKIYYDKEVGEITEDTIPDIPVSYTDLLIDLAASYAMERQPEQFKQMLAIKWEQRARNNILKMLTDSSPNRTASIDRPARPWLL